MTWVINPALAALSGCGWGLQGAGASTAGSISTPASLGGQGTALHSTRQDLAAGRGPAPSTPPVPAPVYMSLSSGRMLSLTSLSSLPSPRQQKEETRLGAQVSVPLPNPSGNWLLQPRLLLEATEPTRWQWDTAGSGRPGTGVNLSPSAGLSFLSPAAKAPWE